MQKVKKVNIVTTIEPPESFEEEDISGEDFNKEDASKQYDINSVDKGSEEAHVDPIQIKPDETKSEEFRSEEFKPEPSQELPPVKNSTTTGTANRPELQVVLRQLQSGINRLILALKTVTGP